MSKGTTFLNCQQYINPISRDYCETVEHMTIDIEARSQGKPTASKSVINLPALGTDDAKRLGYACVGGQAMQKIPGGWKQVMGDVGWQRCRGG